MGGGSVCRTVRGANALTGTVGVEQAFNVRVIGLQEKGSHWLPSLLR
jgi:hypothetical protein